MKYPKAPNSFSVARMAALFLAVAVVIQGCAPAPAPVQAYKALRITAETVDGFMLAAGDLWKAGKITPDEREKIIAAHNVYRLAGKAAASAVKVWSDLVQANAPEARVQAASAAAEKARDELSQKLSTLVETLRASGVKVDP